MQKERVRAVKIDERGKTTIPKELLKLLGIKAGDIMVFAKKMTVQYTWEELNSR